MPEPIKDPAQHIWNDPSSECTPGKCAQLRAAFSAVASGEREAHVVIQGIKVINIIKIIKVSTRSWF